MNELTEEAIEEGRVALIQLEQELKDRERANDAVSVGSNKHHSSMGDERRLLDQMPRVTRLNNRLESLGLTVEELDDRGLLDGGGSVPSYVTSMKNKSRRTLELQSRSHRLQGRGKETITKLLNSFLHMIRTLVRKGLNLESYCRRHDPNRRGLMRKKTFLAMLKAIGLPFTNRELQEITLHYVVPASDQADYVTLMKEAHIVNLGEIDTKLFENDSRMAQLTGPALKEIPEGEIPAPEKDNSVAGGEAQLAAPDRGPELIDLDIGVHTQVLSDVRRMLLESIRSLNKDQDEVYRMFARWDTNGTGTVTATQFLRVLARLHVNLSDQDQDFLVDLLDTSAMGRIDFEGLLSYCFMATSPVGEPIEILSPVAMSGGGSLSVGEDNLGNETMSAVSTENNSVDMKSFNSHALSSAAGANRRPRTATLSRPYNESNVYNASHTGAHPSGTRNNGNSNANGNGMYGTSQAQQYYHQDPSDEYFRSIPNKSNTRMQRPMTASARVSTQNQPTTPTSANGNNGNGRFFVEDGGPPGGRYIKTQSLVLEYGYNDRAGGNSNPGDKPAASNKSNGTPQLKSAPSPANAAAAAMQPALPRVGPHQPLPSHPSAPPQQPPAQFKQLSFRTAEAEDSQYVVELPDDVMYGEEKYLGVDAQHSKNAGKGGKGDPYGHANGGGIAQNRNAQPAMDPRQEMYYNGGNTPHSPDLHDMASFNDNTLVTDQDEYFFGSPKEIPNVAARGANTNDAMNWVSGANAGADSDGRRTRSAEDAGRGYDPRDLSRQPRDRDSRDSRDARNAPPLQLQQPNRGGGNWREARDNGPQGGANTQSQNAAGSGNQMYAPHPQHMLVENDRASAGHYGNHHNAPASQMQSSQNSYESPLPTKEPIEHLVLLANQILSTLREIIMGRYRRGKSLQEIYEHFDRNDKNYFDARDFIIATADLRIETSPRVANIAINMIALDGYDKVCFGEFKVFVLDSDHKLLEMNVQEQLAQMLEQKGREYQTFMVDMFWNEEESLNGSRTPNERPYRQNEFVSKSAFVSSLQRIGLMLTSSELNRLVDRFDMYGNEMCSVPRFVRMVQNSRAWRHGERVLAYQDEAIEEAEYLRQQLSAGDRNGNAANLPKLPEELISMCEYLGIRVLSDANMVWIAADALKAPLPVSWTAQKDANGRTYFYNHLSNQSRLEHPLDPHFRKLRDRYRQGGSTEPELDGSVGMHQPQPSSLPAPNKNSGISFGGMGAGLNPAPLHYNLVGQARPQPPQDQFAHLYTHANAAHGGSHQPTYQNTSIQAAAADDERAYAKYTLTHNGSPGSGNPGSKATPTAPGAGRGAGRRPQSALDRVPQGQYPSTQRDGPSGPQTQPGGVSTGMYTADLKALMGSAAYNRPLSAPQKNNHIDVEHISSYAEATQRMKEKEDRTKTTMEKLETVYKTGHLPANHRPTTSGGMGSSGALPSATGDGKGGRPGSAAKWSAPQPGNSNNMSAVDRALSIGRTNSGFFNAPTRPGGEKEASGNANGNGARERARSANRGATTSNNLANTLGRSLPYDNHVKQSRLQEMYDEAILDKLDSAIGLGRR